MNGIDHVSTVLLTLIHGTWPAGVIPRLAKHPLWFEEGSTFRTKLVTSLANKGISCKIAAFSWSGANSILDRDRAASELAVLYLLLRFVLGAAREEDRGLTLMTT
jgi:hypothetical protein